MNKIAKARLLKLAKFLDKLPRKRFNYDHFVGWDWQGEEDLSCGTTACALGWATTMPEFRRLGLRLTDTGVVNRKYGTYTYEAAADTFKIACMEALYLFRPETEPPWEGLPPSPSHNATAKRVAKHIRDFIKFKGKNGRSSQKRGQWPCL